MTDEQADIWFDTQPIPALEKRAERQLHWFLSHIEKILPNDGYSIGGRPSLADAYFFNLLGETASELGSKGEPFGSLPRTEAVLHEYPRLQHIVDTFKHSPGISDYLAQRSESRFWCA